MRTRAMRGATFLALAFLLLHAAPAPAAVALNRAGEFLSTRGYGGAQLVHPGNFYRLPINSNGKAGDLLVDTGAPSTVIFRGSLRQLGLQETATKFVVAGAFGHGHEHYGVTNISSFRMGNCTMLNVPVAVVSDWEGDGAFRRYGSSDGLFALREMMKFGAVLDLGNRLLFVRPGGQNGDVGTELKRILQQEGYTAVQMTLSRHSHLLVPALVNDWPCHLIVDTGAFLTVIDSDAARQAKIGGTRTRMTPEGIGRSGGTVSVAQFPSLRVGGYQIRNVSAAVTHLNPDVLARGTDMEAAGLLGAEYLGLNSAIFDFNSGTLFLKPRPARRTPP